MSPQKATKKSARRPAASDKPSKGFTAEERAAMKERARELKAEAEKSDGGSGVARLLAMPLSS